jgi:acyl dehydratase
VRPSKSRPQQGLIKVRTTALNQNGEAVQVLVANLMVPRRSGNMPRESSVKAG